MNIIRLNGKLWAEQKMQDAENQVKQAIKEMADAWNRRDGARFGQAFDEQAEFINVRGERSSGLPQRTHFEAPVFEASLKERQLELQSLQVRFIRPDVASVTSMWTLGHRTAANEPQRHGWMHFILSRATDRWDIVEMHTVELR